VEREKDITMGSEKFCLRWNDFESNISSAFKELRDDKDFFDVTLACEDEQIQAHKVILSACSPFFRNILRRNTHQHPLLYLKGIKYSDIQSVLNFMYHGEVNVAQEELNSFLAVAEDLRVKGLTQNHSDTLKQKRETHQSLPQKATSIKLLPGRQSIPPPKSNIPPSPQTTSSFTTEDDIQEIIPVKSEPVDPIVASNRQQSHQSLDLVVSEDPMEAARENICQTQPSTHIVAHEDEQSLSFQEENYEDYGEYGMEQQYEGNMGGGPEVRSEGQFQDPSDLLQFVMTSLLANKKYQCSLCTYEHNIKANVRNHVESVHFPHCFQYPCDQCNKLFPSKNNVQLHRSRMHKQKINN